MPAGFAGIGVLVVENTHHVTWWANPFGWFIHAILQYFKSIYYRMAMIFLTEMKLSANCPKALIK